MDNGVVEKELCPNCKKEIPQLNYVMHTAHCARNISVCSECKESIPKQEMAAHRARHEKMKSAPLKSALPSKMASTTTTWRSPPLPLYVPEKLGHSSQAPPALPNKTSKKDMTACSFCELELPGDTLREHEEYCGARTDKCAKCGEIVMFKNRKQHEDSMHARGQSTSKFTPSESKTKPSSTTFDMRNLNNSLLDYFPPSYGSSSASSTANLPEYRPSGGLARDTRKQDFKEMNRRVDSKTEYIRNLLHDSASITAPLRSSATAPRNRFNHRQSRPDPPTALVIPCEFCAIPIPHEELIQHETGCRPDLARFYPKRVELDEDEEQAAAHSPEVQLPCEFCDNLIPASQLLRHQATCN